MRERTVAMEARFGAGPEIVRVPGWERFPWLRAGFSTRQGGASSVYGDNELNLGWTAEDDPAVVGANRAAFVLAVTGGMAVPLVTVRQVHSGVVRDLEAEVPPWTTDDGKALLEGDGSISRKPGSMLAILTADCAPVLLADTRTHAVGALHAGWRGTLARVVEQGVAAMGDAYGSEPRYLLAAIGPCIGACCFAVGPEVREQFVNAFAGGNRWFRERQGAEGKAVSRWSMDLAAANRQQLLGSGVREGNISVLGECTSCSRLADGRRRFFSHRAEQGVTGRMLSAIGAMS